MVLRLAGLAGGRKGELAAKVEGVLMGYKGEVA